MSPNKGDRTRRILFDDSDPISSIIRAKLRLNSGMATFIIIILFNVPILISAYINGIWFTTGNRAGLFQDYAWWLYQLTSFPVTIIFFLWLPDGVQTVFKGLKNNGVLVQKDLSLNEKDSLSGFIKNSKWSTPAVDGF